jgi:hypothetical protein
VERYDSALVPTQSSNAHSLGSSSTVPTTAVGMTAGSPTSVRYGVGGILV